MISVVMPLYNEGKFIDACIKSMLCQDYPKEDMEWIFVDGNSTDNTKQILLEYQKQYPSLIKVFDNEKKIVPISMNIGIANSKGKYIIRLDAHAEYEKDYFSKCVHYLDTTDAENVGGVLITKAKSKSGKVIAKMLSSKFGVGNSQFRTNGKSGYVDTVPFGAFRREVFTKYGGYDERLVRNQDNEMNYRIRKNGGKIYLSNDIKLAYYCRDTVNDISKMARQNGKWNVITTKLCPGAMGVRHFIPMLFVLSIITLLAVGFALKPFWYLLGAELALYLALDIFFSIKCAKGLKEFLFLFILFITFHVNYGVGSILGIGALCGKKYKKNGYVPKSI